MKKISIHLLCSAYSDVFVTSSKNDIRVWNTNTSKELLRVTVPNMDCHAVDVTKDGRYIVSGKLYSSTNIFAVANALIV